MKPDIWVTDSVKDWFNSWLKPDMVGLEFGSGCSTLWLAQQVKSLVSVEHDPVWYKRVKDMMQEYNVDNVTLVLADSLHYTDVLYDYPSEYFDFIFNDGLAEMRTPCIIDSWSKLKPLGAMIIDNSDARHSQEGIDYIDKQGAMGVRHRGAVTNPWNGRHNEKGVETSIWVK